MCSGGGKVAGAADDPYLQFAGGCSLRSGDFLGVLRLIRKIPFARLRMNLTIRFPAREILKVGLCAFALRFFLFGARGFVL